MAKTKRTYDWPRPAVTVDIALFSVTGSMQDFRLQVLLIQRGQDPFGGRWALPGGFVHEDEDLAAAALRELAEETGVHKVFLEQVTAVGTPGRDPRGHTVTIVWVALVAAAHYRLEASGDAAATQWFDVKSLPPLAFDHAKLLELALVHLRRRIGETPICFELLPTEFTLSELQALCEAILGRELDRRNFRRKVQERGFAAPTGATRAGPHRPAQTFRFVPEAFADHASRSRSLPF